MAVVKDGDAGLWADGQFTVRLRGPGQATGRVIRVRRPFAIVGRHPAADVQIDDPTVESRHVFLILDHRGLFGVDLLTGLGTRFAGAEAGSSWLGPGDILEVAGRRIEVLQLRVDGRAIDPPLSTDDPLAEPRDASTVGLTLEPLDVPGPPWMIGSSMAFLGRGDACAIRIEDQSASKIHCALIRTSDTTYVVDLPGRPTLLNDRPVDGASAMLDGEVLAVGEARFLVRVGPSEPTMPLIGSELSRWSEDVSGSSPIDPREMLMSVLVRAASSIESPSSDVMNMIREFQADTASLLTAQLDRIESLEREIMLLRDEFRSRTGRPPLPEAATPLDLDLAAGTPSPESTAWLLDRLGGLERESRTSWKDLLGKITSTVTPKAGRSIVPTPQKP